MKKFSGICLTLGLATLWACTEVEVVIPLHVPGPIPLLPSEDPGKLPISLDQLKEIQKRKMKEQTGRPPNARCDRNGSRLEVNSEKQETSDWCWAATSRIIMRFHDGLSGKTTHGQCDIVSSSVAGRSNNATCCPSETAPSKTECMGGGWPSVVFEQYGFNYESVGRALDWESLINEICGNGPFLFVVNLKDGGRHALVAAGYLLLNTPQGTDTTSAERFVKVYNPTANDFDYRTLDEFTGDTDSPNAYNHYRDYVQISPKGDGGQP